MRMYEVLCGENRAALSLDGRVRRLNVVTGEVLLSLYCRVSDTLSDWATSGDFLTSSTKTEEVSNTAVTFTNKDVARMLRVFAYTE